MAQIPERYLISRQGLAVRRIDHNDALTQDELKWAEKFNAVLLAPIEQQLTDADRARISQSVQGQADSDELEKVRTEADRAGYMRGEREGYRIAERELKPQLAKAIRERDAARQVGVTLRAQARVKVKPTPKSQLAADLKAAQKRIEALEIKAAAVHDVLGQLEGDGTKDQPWNYAALVQAVRIVKGLTKA